MRILHVFRSPVGGLFRHVRDLARAQSSEGHAVGLVCDSSSGGETARGLLAATEKDCELGILTLPMGRLPGLGDLAVVRKLKEFARELRPDVLHGHGAKGGLHARLAASALGLRSVYTPHGGSLHYSWKNPAGAMFLAAERYLARKGGGFIFVCEFEKRLFMEKIGLAGKPATVVHNGLWPDEFSPAVPDADAKDLLFVGEVRHLKGIDILLDALRLMAPGRKASLAIVGDGPELESYRRTVAKLGIEKQVSFEGRKPIRDAFKLGRVMVVPSRNESFPYVVLEAIAASVPLIATSVGGIPEVLPESMRIAKPDAALLAEKIAAVLDNSLKARADAEALSLAIRKDYSVKTMAAKISSFYSTLRA